MSSSKNAVVKVVQNAADIKAPMLDPVGFEKALTLIRCLDNRNRLAILCLLCDTELGVTEMAAEAGLSLSAMSQHLSVLRHAGLVTTEKRQQQVIYRLSSDEVKAVIGLLKGLYCHPGNPQLPGGVE